MSFNNIKNRQEKKIPSIRSYEQAGVVIMQINTLRSVQVSRLDKIRNRTTRVNGWHQKKNICKK